MAGDALTQTDTTDYSAMYRDEAAPVDQTPQDKLFNEISGSLKTPTAGVPAVPAPGVKPGVVQAPTGPSSTTQASGASQGLADRLKPLGVTGLETLRGKTDVELRKLSTDVVTYELRQQTLAKSFRKNPDGSWDFTMGPDGNPTGLDATGKTVPPAGAPATPGSPAAKPTVPYKKPATKPGGAAKPAARKPVARRAAVTKRSAAPARAPAKKVTRPPVKATVTKAPVRKPAAPVVRRPSAAARPS